MTSAPAGCWAGVSMWPASAPSCSSRQSSAGWYGGPDSRTLPNAQPVDEVARAIADLIEHPRAELYTRPELATLAARYFSADDVATLEAGPPFAMPRR